MIKELSVILPLHNKEHCIEHTIKTLLSIELIEKLQIIIIENADLELFGLLISKMHMIWVRIVGGRLKTDLRYSVKIVYNTFPVPTKGYSSLKKFAEKIIEVRKNHPESTLVDLYNPNSMLPDLKKAHANLDREVEKLYRTKPFESDNERAEFLLSMYLKMIDKT